VIFQPFGEFPQSSTRPGVESSGGGEVRRIGVDIERGRLNSDGAVDVERFFKLLNSRAIR